MHLHQSLSFTLISAAVVSCYDDLPSFTINSARDSRQESIALKFLFRSYRLLVHSSSMIRYIFSFITYCIISYHYPSVVPEFNYLSPFFD